MTDNYDNTNEELSISATASLPQESMREESDGDFANAGLDDDGNEMDSDDLESAGGELTPNDIFGLDPLDVLTLEELAEYLKISPAAARRAVKEQNLPGRNIGGEWRFLRDAVANWLRGQEAPAQQQQKAREDYSKPKATPPATPAQSSESERYSRPPQRPYQSDQSSGGEYRSRQRFPEGGQQYGNQGGGQYGNRGGQYGGGQYGGGQSGGGQSAGGQYSGGGQSGGGNYGGGGGGSAEGSYSRPPRRPFRSTEGGGEGRYEAGGAQGGGAGGYSGGGGGEGGGGARFGGGGYAAGGQRFSGGPKRKNKRQVFDNERGKRLDRRKEGETTEGQE